MIINNNFCIKLVRLVIISNKVELNGRIEVGFKNNILVDFEIENLRTANKEQVKRGEKN